MRILSWPWKLESNNSSMHVRYWLSKLHLKYHVPEAYKARTFCHNPFEIRQVKNRCWCDSFSSLQSGHITSLVQYKYPFRIPLVIASHSPPWHL
ncbi:hypothetical protein H5410_011226 [Solanum commersonii]|uniref:Uncharacterized protein n=1 Tax=Solanum commersonii TaxID=4109 RepID=A0A9J6AMY0_SOLCO|nr:hypothetical protein H5410_011226 [Solanum commersonii]